MTAFFRRHAAAVWLGTAVLVCLGVASALDLPSGIYPEIEFPRIVVVARSGGAPPDVFLSAFTRPLEQQLVTVIGVQRVRSKTIRGATEISLQFAPDTDMWRALQLVESRVGEARSDLPAGAELVVERVTTGSFPVVTFNVSGALDPRELREISELVVRPAIGNVAGVGRVEVLGGDVREVEVIADPTTLASLHLTLRDVSSKLQTGMGLVAVGRALDEQQALTVLADAQPKTLDDIRAMPIVTTQQGGVITLGSTAEVVEGAADRSVRIGGPRGETVVVSVARLPGASTPTVVRDALSAIDALRPTLPPSVQITPVYDQSILVDESMANVRDAILIGIALCALVISVFLRDVFSGVLAGVCVPVTFAITFVAMRIGHQTLNLMSLGGMAVAVGLVVDDAIVMIEAIAKRRELGDEPQAAAAKGTAELAPAVIGTSITTVIVFLPLAFLQGVVGDFFRALAFTVTTAVMVSLAIALILVPLAAGWKRARRTSPETGSSLIRGYPRLVEGTLAHRWIAPLGLVVSVAAIALVAPHLERGFLPTMDEGAFVIDCFLPAGTSLEATERYSRIVERDLRETPEVVSYSRRTGAELGPAAATQANRGDIMVRLKSRGDRKRSADVVIADVRARIERDVPEARVEFVQVLQDVLNDLAGNPRPIEVQIFGPDYLKLHELASQIGTRVRRVPGVVDVYDGEERSVPEMRLSIDRNAAARLGTNPDEVSSELDAALHGRIVGAVRRFERLVNVRTRYPNPVRYDRAQILDMPFTAHDRVTTLRAVSTVTITQSEPALLHEALQPIVLITADHEGRDLGSVASDVDAIIRSTKLPQGYRVVLGGQAAAERSSLKQLLGVGAFALLLVLTVLAAQFRRPRIAALVLGVVPVAILGGVLALFITRVPLNASSLMGGVLLVGLVVKNGVLLLEHAEHGVDAGALPSEAVRQAAERRVRPIVMTTVATLAGLAPLALGLGAGAEIQRPLAIVVIGGLITSTFATLVVLPSIAASILRAKSLE